MAGTIVIWETAKFTMGYTAGSVPATELHLKWGTAPGSYPNSKTYPVMASQSDLIKNVLPGPGQYYAILVAANAVGEGAKSAELPFVAVSGLPDGTLSLSIG
jgi:hypothetical protein